MYLNLSKTLDLLGTYSTKASPGYKHPPSFSCVLRTMGRRKAAKDQGLELTILNDSKQLLTYS